jgi:hypothetical protein
MKIRKFFVLLVSITLISVVMLSDQKAFNSPAYASACPDFSNGIKPYSTQFSNGRIGENNWIRVTARDISGCARSAKYTIFSMDGSDSQVINANVIRQGLITVFEFNFVPQARSYTGVMEIYAWGSEKFIYQYDSNTVSIGPNYLPRVQQPTKYASCDEVWSIYPGGISKNKKVINYKGKKKKKVAKTTITPTVNRNLYSTHKSLDKDGDGIVCER